MNDDSLFRVCERLIERSEADLSGGGEELVDELHVADIVFLIGDDAEEVAELVGFGVVELLTQGAEDVLDLGKGDLARAGALALAALGALDDARPAEPLLPSVDGPRWYFDSCPLLLGVEAPCNFWLGDHHVAYLPPDQGWSTPSDFCSHTHLGAQGGARPPWVLPGTFPVHERHNGVVD